MSIKYWKNFFSVLFLKQEEKTSPEKLEILTVVIPAAKERYVTHSTIFFHRIGNFSQIIRKLTNL